MTGRNDDDDDTRYLLRTSHACEACAYDGRVRDAGSGGTVRVIYGKPGRRIFPGECGRVAAIRNPFFRVLVTVLVEDGFILSRARSNC